MVQDRISHPSRRALRRFSVERGGLIAAFMACVSASVQAAPPLVLNTQMGISDGQSGLVLQNAPLSQEPMVQAAQPAGIAPESSPPLIVAPYV